MRWAFRPVAITLGVGEARLLAGPALAHEKPLADPAVNIQTDFNAFNIYVPVHQIRFALRAASPVHLVYAFAAGGLTRRT